MNICIKITRIADLSKQCAYFVQTRGLTEQYESIHLSLSLSLSFLIVVIPY